VDELKKMRPAEKDIELEEYFLQDAKPLVFGLRQEILHFKRALSPILKSFIR